MIKVEHLWWCSPLVSICFIIVKVLGSIHYTYNLNACLEGKGVGDYDVDET